MSRTLQNLITLRNFGGLRDDVDEHAMPPTDARACYNVHTARGVIEARPGWEAYYTVDGILLAPAQAVKVVHARGEEYLVTWGRLWNDPLWDSTSATQTNVWNLQSSTRTATAAQVHGTEYPGRRASIVGYGNTIYVATGDASTSQKIYKRGTEWRTARFGIAQAPYPELREWGTGGTLIGTFRYRVTWYNEDTGTESQASLWPEITVVGPVSSQVLLFLDPPTDTQITGFKIYRKKIGTHARFYWIATVSDPQPYDHNVDPGDFSGFNGTWWFSDTGEDTYPALDSFLGEAPELGQLPPASHHIAIYKNRMWYGLDDSNKVRYSEERGLLELVNPTISFACGGALDHITGLVSIFGRLIVFKEHSIWQITGSSPASFAVTNVSHEIGCVSEHAVTEANGVLYFVALDGLYRLVGTGVQRVSYKLKNPLGFFNEGRLKWTTLAHDAERHLLIISGYTGTSDLVDGYAGQLAYDYQRDNWFPWTLPVTAIVSTPSSGNKRLIVTDNDNRGGSDIYLPSKLTGHQDGGADINWRWETPLMLLGTRRKKHWYYLGVQTPEKDTEEDVSLLVSSGDTYANLGDATEARPLARLARSLTFGVKGASGSAPDGKVAALEIDAEVVQPR